MFDFAFEWLSGTLYGGLITIIALLAAIPYGIWQGMKRLGAWVKGENRNGNS